jgi:hypothetical protein
MAFDPLTMALIMGGSAAIKGIGQGISGYQAAEGMMSDTEKEMLRKLQREQELGMLGYSSGEMSDLTRQFRNPQQAIAKAQGDQLKQAMAVQDRGAADAFRLAMIQEEEQRQANAKIADTVAAMNQAERAREEQLLLGLANRESQQEAAKKAAITQAITLGIGGAAETGAQGALLAQQLQQKEKLNADQLKLQQEYLDKLDTLSEYGITMSMGANMGGIG